MKVVSLFSGCGGFDLGFIQAGFDIVFANDFDKSACETYKHNIGDIVCKDIKEISSNEIPDCDVVIGGFPCQGFSVCNTDRSMEDERNHLYKEILRIVEDKQPKVFVCENVRGILSMEKGKVIEMIVNDFKELGYDVDYKLLKCKEYGIPQMRERVIIIGNRIGVENKFPTPTGEDIVTVREAIGWLNDIKCFREPITKGNKRILNHVAGKRSDIVWDNELGKYRPTKFKTYKNRVRWDDLCFTILARWGYTHPEQSRALSIRESAIIQTFPDDFEFMGSLSAMYRQVGNAVPVKLAYLIGCCVKEMIKDGER